MIRDVLLGSPFGSRLFLILLLVPLGFFGCTRELEEKLAGKERELSDTQITLKGVQDKLTALEASYAQQSEASRQLEQQRNDLTGQIKTLEDTRAMLEQSLAQSQAELAERQQTLDRRRQDQQALASQLGDRDSRIQEMAQQGAALSQRIHELERKQSE